MFVKYIILKKNFAAIMFDQAVQHCEIAEVFGGVEAVKSAGVFTLTTSSGGLINIRCFGGSTSLGGLLADSAMDPLRIQHALGLD